MAEAIKFTFDEMFDTSASNSNGQETVVVAPKKTRWTEEEIDAIKAEAYAEGQTAAQNATATKTAQETAAAFETIANTVSNSLEQLAQSENNTRVEAASLALMVGRKLADVLISLRPEDEIEAVIQECLTHLSREPRLIVRVNATLSERIKNTIHQAAEERGMSDKIMIVGTDEIEIGDCEIEWSDGGVARNRADLDRQTTNIIDRYIETLTGGSEQSAHEENNHD